MIGIMEYRAKIARVSETLRFANFGGSENGLSPLQTVNKKLFSPEGGE